jgi:hypothetical protein
MVTVELGVVKEEVAMGMEEVVAVAVAVDVAAAVLGPVGAVEGVVRVEEVVAETVEVNKVAELLVAEEGKGREVNEMNEVLLVIVDFSVNHFVLSIINNDVTPTFIDSFMQSCYKHIDWKISEGIEYFSVFYDKHIIYFLLY